MKWLMWTGALTALLVVASILYILVWFWYGRGPLLSSLSGDAVTLKSWVEYDGGTYRRRKTLGSWSLRIPADITSRGYASANGFDPWARVQHRWLWENRNPKNSSRITIFSRISPEGELVGYKPPNDANANFQIDIDNNLVKVRVADQNYCVAGEQLRKFGGPGPSIPPCSDGGEACIIVTNYRGWSARVWVAKNGLYEDQEKVCRILRAALDKWTISITDLRTLSESGSNK